MKKAKNEIIKVVLKHKMDKVPERTLTFSTPGEATRYIKYLLINSLADKYLYDYEATITYINEGETK
jgi:hypothetical protein